ncbi:MAG TPA: 6-phosphogluconolactonase [Gemmatimonadales bacterium]|jgi:6-phosphogluconolactonase
MTELVVVARPADLARPAAEWLELEMARAIGERGTCALALAGGHTPEPAYRELARASSVDWRRVQVFFGDERSVPPDHADSNYRMVQAALLSRVVIPAGQIHRMEAERADRDAAARDYERVMPPRLDILLLGIGPDGHTASLFPGSPALDERQRLVVPVLGAKPPAERMTITPPVIEAARKVMVLASGGDKAAVVARALEGPLALQAVPAQLARRGTWFLDQAAAARLTAPRITA